MVKGVPSYGQHVFGHECFTAVTAETAETAETVDPTEPSVTVETEEPR